MTPLANHHRPFGNTGLRIPPIIFGTAALSNARRVIPDQTKLELCGEFFRHVASPVALDVSPQCGDGGALAVLARAMDRLEVAPDELVIIHRIRCEDMPLGYDAVRASWDSACSLLGCDRRPQLVAVEPPQDYLSSVLSPADRSQRFQGLVAAFDTLNELKAAGELAGVGVAAHDWQVAEEILAAVQLDWVMLIGSYTIMSHPPALVKFMGSLAERQIPIISAGVFHCGFLAGGSAFDERVMDPENPADQTLLSWRKAFVALCHGQAITPAHACIQFSLSGRGVVAVSVNSSRCERIAENVASTITTVPDAFWESLKEEGLLNL